MCFKGNKGLEWWGIWGMAFGTEVWFWRSCCLVGKFSHGEIKVETLDCVGHVQKRMGKHLLNLRQNTIGTSFPTRREVDVAVYAMKKKNIIATLHHNIKSDNPANVWIFNKGYYLNGYGRTLNPNDSPLNWISDHLNSPWIAPTRSSCIMKFL